MWGGGGNSIRMENADWQEPVSSLGVKRLFFCFQIFSTRYPHFCSGGLRQRNIRMKQIFLQCFR